MPSSNRQNNEPGQGRPPAAQDALAAVEPARPARDPLVGTTIGGRYHVERELGAGGIGKVYFARDKPELISRPVVIKVLREESLKSPWIINKFQHEIEALASIDDPCVTGILDAGELPDGSPYLVMQYVDGVTLRSLIEPVKDRGMEIESAANILRQVCRALASAHEKRIYHRDLKPENIMVRHPGTAKEQAKIIDFGIAKVTNSVLAPTTGVGKIVGTVAYMSPEQLGAEPVTAASDIYSLGIIAYEMLTGRRPFNFETIYQLPALQAAGVQVGPKSLRPALPEKAQAIILRALAFDPADRYARVSEFGDDLARALTSTDVNAGSDEDDKIETLREPWPAPLRKAGPGRVLIPVLVLLLLAAVGIVAWRVMRPAAGTKTANDQAVSSGPAPPAPAPARTMDYYMVVQRYRNGAPYKKPFTLPGEINFESDDRVQIFFTSPEPGYFYLINEGPKVNDAPPNLIVLFPDKDRSAMLPANQQVRIPDPSDEEEWVLFDKAEGTEKLWLVWSAQPVAELEAVKKWANPKDVGEVRDAAEDKKVREFLSKYYSDSSPVPKQNEERTRTTVTGKGGVLVYPVKLQHH